MNNVWIFGCSFSSGYLDVPKTESYGNLLANKLGYIPKNIANPGNSNDKLLFDLISNIKFIQKNDILIYQFSLFNRIGFFKTSNSDSYFSSAGIPELGIRHKQKEYSFRDYSIEKLDIMLNYILEWNHLRYKFSLESALDLISFLEKEKGIKPVIIFMSNDIIFDNKYVLKLPTKNNKDNYSFRDFLIDKKLTIGDEFPERFSNDDHPGFSGHREMANIIEKVLDKKFI